MKSKKTKNQKNSDISPDNEKFFDNGDDKTNTDDSPDIPAKRKTKKQKQIEIEEGSLYENTPKATTYNPEAHGRTNRLYVFKNNRTCLVTYDDCKDEPITTRL